MKQGSNSRRTRGRRNSDKRSSNRNNNHDNVGSDKRLRGNASQVYEKYLALARDALSADDSISSENYSQHAEHFYRIMAINAENQKNTNNSGQNHENDKANDETNNQKSRGRNRRNNNNNRSNNHKIDTILVDQNEKNQIIEEQVPPKPKIIKTVDIQTSERSPNEDESYTDGTPQES